MAMRKPSTRDTLWGPDLNGTVSVAGGPQERSRSATAAFLFAIGLGVPVGILGLVPVLGDVDPFGSVYFALGVGLGVAAGLIAVLAGRSRLTLAWLLGAYAGFLAAAFLVDSFGTMDKQRLGEAASILSLIWPCWLLIGLVPAVAAAWLLRWLRAMVGG